MQFGGAAGLVQHPNQYAVDRESTVDNDFDDSITMRTESIAPDEIAEYEQEKSAMHS